MYLGLISQFLSSNNTPCTHTLTLAMAFTVALPDDSTVGSLVCTAVTAPDNLNLNEDETGVATLFTVDTDVNVMEPLSATIQVVDNEGMCA